MLILFLIAGGGIGFTMYLMFQNKVADIKGNGLSVQEMQRSRESTIENPDSIMALELTWMDSVSAPETLTLIQEVEDKTAQMDQFLRELNTNIAVIGEVEPELNILRSPMETQRNYTFWMKDETANAGRGSGMAMSLKDSLDEFTLWANDFVANRAEEQGLGIFISIEGITTIPTSGGNSTWEYITFHHKTVSDNLDTIDELGAQVKIVRYQCLQAIPSRK